MRDNAADTHTQTYTQHRDNTADTEQTQYSTDTNTQQTTQQPQHTPIQPTYTADTQHTTTHGCCAWPAWRLKLSANAQAGEEAQVVEAREARDPQGTFPGAGVTLSMPGARKCPFQSYPWDCSATK